MSDTVRHGGYKVPRAAGMQNGLVKQVNGGQEASEKEAGAVSPRAVKGARPGGGRGLERGESLETSGTKYLRTQQPIPKGRGPCMFLQSPGF